MTYTMTLIIDLVKIFNYYLIGCIFALMCWLIIKIKYHAYLKKKYKGQKIKDMWKNYINKDILFILLSWYVPIIILYEIAEEILNKLNRKYYRSYKYRRFKDILLFRKKRITINNYFERVLKGDIKRISIEQLIYRIKKGDIVMSRYSEIAWQDIKDEITSDNIKHFFRSEDICYLESLYKDLVKKRFMGRYEQVI